MRFARKRPAHRCTYEELQARYTAVPRTPRPPANSRMTRARLESSARPLRERTRRWISLRSGGVRINRLVATNRSYQLRGRYQCYTALVAEFNRQYPGNKARENYE